MLDAQITVLKAAIAAEIDAGFVLARQAGDSGSMAAFFNGASTFVVWKTKLTHDEVINTTNPDASTFSWSALIGRTQQEQFAWGVIFRNGWINPSLATVRQAFIDIFNGATGLAQRNYLALVAKRFATRGEKLFATGLGTLAAPGLLVFEGTVSIGDIDAALRAP